MIREAIKKVVEKDDLTFDEAQRVMGEIMEGNATPTQIACFITALRMKGETIEEISGLAQAMRAHAIKVEPKEEVVVDTCGTGGDLLHTFNISTCAAFVVAGAGVSVAKHGNRSVSSATGSADVLETLGVRINLPSGIIAKCIDEIGMGFMFAPTLHPAMKYAIGPRKEIGIRTVFNILGPLTNPASAKAQVLGVYDGKLTEKMAEVLGKLGAKHALVVHGADGMDEISTTGKSKISEYKDGSVTTYRISPDQFNIPRTNIEQLKGGDPNQNAQILKGILKGEEGPKRDIVVLNAAAALVAAEKAKDIEEGIKLAEESINQGEALEKLKKLIECTNKF